MRKAAGLAAMLTFFVVLVCTDWVGYAVSMALFRIAPATVPDGFYTVLPAPRAEAGARYVPASWQNLEEVKRQRGVQTYRLPAPEAYIGGPKTQFRATVLEDDGTRQLVRVESTGLLRMNSRYEAYADRIVPVAYRSFAWEYERQRSWTAFALGLLLPLVAAIAVGWTVNRVSSRAAGASKNPQVETGESSTAGDKARR